MEFISKRTNSDSKETSTSSMGAYAKALQNQTKKLKERMKALEANSTSDIFNQDNSNMFGNFSQLKSFNPSMFSYYAQNDATRVTPADLKIKLEEIKYDVGFSKQLAQKAKLHSKGIFTSQCGKYVRETIESTGINLGGAGGYPSMMPDKLKRQGFKEIAYNGDPRNLPDGTIAVFAPGVSGYNPQHGHIEVIAGGKGYSDGITNNLRTGARYFVKVRSGINQTA